MKSRLSKTELTGLILLALLVIAITGGAILMKGCSEEQGEQQEVPREDVRIIGAEDEEEEGGYGYDRGKTSRRKGGRKASGRRSTSKGSASQRGGKTQKTKSQNSVELYDPFSDTIPMEEDD